jgi:ComF family protein
LPFVASLLNRAARAALDLLYPPQCALCGRAGALLCEDCAALLTPAAGMRCRHCWMPGPARCRHCASEPPAFEALRAAYVMEGGARRLAHELKYEGMTALAEPMALLMDQALDARDFDVVVPVPLHARRERSRGYNQAALLAQALASLRESTYDRVAARRTRDTLPLAKTMHRDERRRIMRGAFQAIPERVDRRRVLLVDDIATTGATLDECARAMLAAGAASVTCAVWARAD